MANTSPNMSLPIPTVGVESAPQWATLLDSCMTIIDGHNHASGSGVQINPAGININSDLTINDNNLILARSLRFNPNLVAIGGPDDIGCLYEAGVDLYYNDGSGNQIRITQSGSVAGSSGTITGLPSGTASASYAAGTFVFQSATNTSAVIDGGSFILRNATASSHGLTLAPPNAMGADYSLVLPTIPASLSLMTLDASGNMGTSTTVPSSAIPTGSLSPKQTAPNYAKSSSCGNFVTSSATAVAVTNLSVSVTSGANPIEIMCLPDGTTNTISVGYISANTSSMFIYLYKNGSPFAQTALGVNPSSGTAPITIPSSAIRFFDFAPGASPNTYAIFVKSNSGSIQVNTTVLLAKEMV